MIAALQPLADALTRVGTWLRDQIVQPDPWETFAGELLDRHQTAKDATSPIHRELADVIHGSAVSALTPAFRDHLWARHFGGPAPLWLALECWRHDHQISRAELALQAGVSVETIRRIEMKYEHTPSATTVARIRAAMADVERCPQPPTPVPQDDAEPELAPEPALVAGPAPRRRAPGHGMLSRAGAGERLTRRRLGAGLTQLELATRAGLAQGTVSKIEIGQCQPKRATRRRLYRALREVLK